jgi:hypothetical protein
MLPFSLKECQQANPLQVPQRGLYGEKYPLTGHFCPSLNICLSTFPSRVPDKGAPSMFPNRIPMGSDTPSPEPLVYFPFIHSFMCVCQSPQKGDLLHTYGEKQGHHPRTPTQTEGLHSVGCSLVPQGDHYGTAISTQYLPLWLG